MLIIDCVSGIRIALHPIPNFSIISKSFIEWKKFFNANDEVFLHIAFIVKKIKEENVDDGDP